MTMLFLMACILSSCSLTAKPDFSRGKWEGDIYTNESAGLSFQLPEEWTFSDDKDLASRMRVSADQLSQPGTPFNENMAAIPSVYDMIAINTNGAVIMVIFENLNLIADGLNMTEEDYMAILQASIEKMGAGFTFSEIVDAKIGNQTYKMTEVDIGVAAQQYYVRKVGSHMVVISVRASGDDDLTAIMANFS